MKIISGSSNRVFAEKLSKKMHAQLVDIVIDKYPNGEKKIRILDRITNADIIIVQSFSHPVDEHIIETILLIDAAKRLNPRKIHLVIPWLGYSLQDKVYLSGEPLSSYVIAKLLSVTGVDDIRVLDVHKESMLSYFTIPIYNLSAIHLLISYIQSVVDVSRLVIASPDQGAITRAKYVSNFLQRPIISLRKIRDRVTGAISFTKTKTALNDHDILIVDDGIITGNTLLGAFSVLKKNGARKIHFYATHCVLSKIPQEKRIMKCIDTFITTNSIYSNSESTKIHILDTTSIIAKSFMT